MVPSNICRRATSVTLCILAAFACAIAFGQQQSLSIATVHFNVKYQRGTSEQDARKVAEYLQSDYNYLSEKLGLDFKKPLEVRIHESVGKFSSQTNRTPSWRGAILLRSVLHVQPVGALEARKIFEQSLSFELAVALLQQAAENGCPRWLREAFAVYHSGSSTTVTPPVGVRLATFSDIEQDLQTFPNPPQRDDVQYVLGSTMRFLVEKYGERNVLMLYKTFDGATSIEDVFRKCLNADFSVVERAWALHITSAPEPAKR